MTFMLSLLSVLTQQAVGLVQMLLLGTTRYDLSLVVRKPVYGVSDQVPHKPVCTVTEDG